MEEENLEVELGKYEKYFDKNVAHRLLKKLRKATRNKPIEVVTRRVVDALGTLLSAYENPDMPKKYKVLIIGTIGYIILPLDLIPDLTPGVGYIDDLGAAAVVISMVVAYSKFDIKKLDAEIDAES